MRLSNTQDSYGLLAVTLHWLVAITVVGLFALGLWMVELTYYDDWYRSAPAIHKAVGVLLFIVVALRLGWRTRGPRPAPVASHSTLERRAAATAHILLYALLFAVMLSGYLISTADGRPVDVLGVFQVPALISDLPGQADIAGKVHLYLAVSLVSLAGLHALAALKHHVIDRDPTLLRMLGRDPARSPRGRRAPAAPLDS
ncbi:MAG: cytochrome b [Gammaproteobacteria bacterium]|jgi:cytochrome b561|nr:cytochrome b [Gammaproteobacteria bacterium]